MNCFLVLLANETSNNISRTKSFLSGSFNVKMKYLPGIAAHCQHSRDLAFQHEATVKIKLKPVIKISFIFQRIPRLHVCQATEKNFDAIPCWPELTFLNLASKRATPNEKSNSLEIT